MNDIADLTECHTPLFGVDEHSPVGPNTVKDGEDVNRKIKYRNDGPSPVENGGDDLTSHDI